MISVSYQSHESYDSNGFPSHWIEQRVKDIALLERGKFTHRPRNDPQMYGGTHPFIQTGDVARASKYVTTYSQTLSDKGTTVSKFFPKGTLVMAIAANIGDVAIVDFDTYFPDSIVAYKTKRNDIDYLFYLFSAKKHELDKVKITNTQDNLNLERLNSLVRVIPALDEQKAIATYLDTKNAQIDRKIDLLTQKSQRYEELKRSLINETITRGLDKSVPMKDSGIEWIGEIPEHWVVIRNKDIFEESKNKAGAKSSDYKVLSLTLKGVIERDLISNKGKIPASFDSYQIVQKDQIVLCLFDMDVTPRIVGYIEQEGLLTSAYTILKSNPDICMKYYYYYFLAQNANKSLLAHSKTLRSTLRFDDFCALPVPKPTTSEQKEIADYLDKNLAQIDQIVQTINTQVEIQKELRKTLINDVVTGKIKVA